MFRYYSEVCFTLVLLGQLVGIAVGLWRGDDLGLYISQGTLALGCVLVLPMCPGATADNKKHKK